MKPHKQPIRITKIEAAHRQLHSAIALYFQDGEPASIHTLTWAAREILSGLNKHHGIGPMLLDVDLMPPELQSQPKLRKAFYDDLASAGNFLKHSSRDPSAVLELSPARTELLLIDAVNKHWEIAGHTFDLGVCFLCYMAVLRSELFGASFVGLIRQLLPVQDFTTIGRKEFLKRCAPAILASKHK